MNLHRWIVRIFFCAAVSLAAAQAQENLLQDPSFEQTKEKDRFGLVFAKWGGWKYEGDCDFAVGRVAHSGRSSCLLVGSSAPKLRVVQLQELAAGRYQITAYLRGLDIGVGIRNQTTEFMFDGHYFSLKKHGTFGWPSTVARTTTPGATRRPTASSSRPSISSNCAPGSMITATC